MIKFSNFFLTFASKFEDIGRYLLVVAKNFCERLPKAYHQFSLFFFANKIRNEGLTEWYYVRLNKNPFILKLPMGILFGSPCIIKPGKIGQKPPYHSFIGIDYKNPMSEIWRRAYIKSPLSVNYSSKISKLRIFPHIKSFVIVFGLRLYNYIIDLLRVQQQRLTGKDAQKAYVIVQTIKKLVERGLTRPSAYACA